MRWMSVRYFERSRFDDSAIDRASIHCQRIYQWSFSLTFDENMNLRRRSRAQSRFLNKVWTHHLRSNDVSHVNDQRDIRKLDASYWESYRFWSHRSCNDEVAFKIDLSYRWYHNHDELNLSMRKVSRVLRNECSFEDIRIESLRKIAFWFCIDHCSTQDCQLC